MNGANLLAIGAMAVATFGCRAGGYWVFSRLPPSAFLRSVMSYLPGALFVAFVVPALADGGAKEWLAAITCLAIMASTRRFVVAVVVGTAVAWAGWSAGL